ncbi:hypothetical protein MTR67_034846, partial [Solanum verrucosum]
PGCCCCFTVASWVAGGQQLELLPSGLRRWNSIGDGAAAMRGEREEGRRRGEKGEEERDVAASSGLAGAASREGRRIERAAALFFGEEEELIVLGFWGLWFVISFFKKKVLIPTTGCRYLLK